MEVEVMMWRSRWEALRKRVENCKAELINPWSVDVWMCEIATEIK